VSAMPIRNSAGFTLIELMLVVAIVGVLAVFGLPAMRDLIVANRMKTLSLDIYSSLALARSEAVKRNVGSVSMIANGGNWQSGWTVTCVDSGGSCGGSDLVLTAEDAVDPSISLTVIDPSTSNPVTTITYSRDGRLSTAAASFRIVYTANNSAVPMRCVELSVSGRPRTLADSNATDSDGCN
jgi:type IV fimbrial biogenesis protein FimT